MVSYNHASNHFILYETDNIPNYESHRYGCSKRMMALRTLTCAVVLINKTNKKPH